MAPGLSIRAGGASRLRACASTAEKWLVGTRTPWRQPGLGPGPWLLIVSKARGSPAGQFGDVLLGHLRYIGISVQVQVEVQVQDQVQVLAFEPGQWGHPRTTGPQGPEWRYSSTCMPSSTTRFGGMPKNAVAGRALRERKAKSDLRQCHIPPLRPVSRVSRPR